MSDKYVYRFSPSLVSIPFHLRHPREAWADLPQRTFYDIRSLGATTVVYCGLGQLFPASELHRELMHSIVHQPPLDMAGSKSQLFFELTPYAMR